MAEEIARKSVVVEYLVEAKELEKGMKDVEAKIVQSTKVINGELKGVADQAKKAGEQIGKAYTPAQEEAKKAAENTKRLNDELRIEIQNRNELGAEQKRLTRIVKEYEAEIKQLNKLLARERDPAIQDQIRAEIGVREKKIATVRKNIDTATKDIASTNATIKALREQGGTLGTVRDLVEDYTAVLALFGGRSAEVSDQINNLADRFDEVGPRIRAFIDGAVTAVQERFKTFSQSIAQTPLGQFVGAVRDRFVDFGNRVATVFDNLSANVQKRLSDIGQYFAPFVAVLNVAGQKLAGVFSAATAGIGRLLTAAAKLPLIQKALNGAAVAARVFGVALAATGVGALVVALGAIVVFFTQTQKGAKALKEATAPLAQVWDRLAEVVGGLGGKIVTALKNPKQAIIDLGKLILENLVNRFTGLAVLVQGLFTLDGKKLQDGLIQVTTGVTNATEKLAVLKKEIADAYAIGQQILALREKADQLDQNRATFEAQITRNVFEQKKILDDENASSAKKITALKEILKQETLGIERQREALKLRLQARELELKNAGDASTAAKKELDELQAEIDALDQSLREKEYETARAIAALRVSFLQGLANQLEKAKKPLEDLVKQFGSDAWEKQLKKVRQLEEQYDRYAGAIQRALGFQQQMLDLEKQLTEQLEKEAEARYEAQAAIDGTLEQQVEYWRRRIAIQEKYGNIEKQDLEKFLKLSADLEYKKRTGSTKEEVAAREKDLQATRAGEEKKRDTIDDILNEIADKRKSDFKREQDAIKANYQEKFVAAKVAGASDQELAEITAQKDKELADSRRDYINGLGEEIFKINTEIAQGVISVLEDVTARQVQKYQEAVDLQTERVERFKELAKTGSAEQLVIEEERLARLTELQERAQARQRRLAEAQLLLNQAITVSESVKAIATAFGSSGPLGIITGIAASIALATTLASAASQISGLFGSLPQFRTGSEFIEGKGTGTSDSIVARVSRGERIVPYRENAEIARMGGIPNKRLPEAVAAWHSGPVIIDAINQGNLAMISEMREVRNELQLSRMEAQRTRISILATRKGLAALVSEHSYNDKFNRR